MSSRYTYNPHYEERIQQTIESALLRHPRLSCIFTVLHFPVRGDSRQDAAVISRFFETLKYQIRSWMVGKSALGKRVHPTTLQYVWVREFGGITGNKHYHVLLLLNKDTFYTLGQYSAPQEGALSLANLIQKAWCSALNLPWYPQNASLVAFPPRLPCMHIDKHTNEQDQHQIFQRARYMAKESTKYSGDGERSFGCSRTDPVLITPDV